MFFGLMKHFCAIVAFAMFIAPAYADDITCPAGQYLNDTGECVTLCDPGYWRNDNGECVACSNSGYYCPGDNSKKACPAIEGRESYLWLDSYPGMTLRRQGFYTHTLTAYSITDCIINYGLYDERGSLPYKQSYNPTTDKYDAFYAAWWSYPYAGYYVTQLRTCPSVATYSAIAPCVAGGYCPGQTGSWSCSNGTAPANYGLYTCPDNTYSDDGASACTPCPWGRGNTGDDVTAHAGEQSCQPIECPAGQYLADDGYTCTPCEVGYYCPGDNTLHNCTDLPLTPNVSYAYNIPFYSDERGLSECKACPEIDDPDAERPTSYHYNDNTYDDDAPHRSVAYCRAVWREYQVEHGTVFVSCGHGGYGYTHDQSRCQVAKYGNQSRCDAGYFVNGDSSSDVNIFFSGFHNLTDYVACVPVPIGFYSPADALTATQCPAGTSTHGTTSTSADDCLALCPAGVSEFHAGGLTYSLWRDKPTDIAINVGYRNQVCYVGLMPGDAPDGTTALHVSVGKTTYHAVN